MVRYWGRELAGWLLILLGLAFLIVAAACLLSPDVELLIAAPMMSVMGIVIFRGGIHLLKVAVAARICLATQLEVKSQAEKPRNKSDSPWDW